MHVPAGPPHLRALLQRGDDAFRRRSHTRDLVLLVVLTEHARQQGLNVSMNSNGWLLDKAAAEKIKASGFRSVGISIDSAEAALHDDFRNRPGSFDKAVAALDALAEAGVRSTMSSVISTTT